MRCGLRPCAYVAPSTDIIDPTSLLAVSVRAKSTHQRSYEEKRWLGIDMILNPQYYRKQSAEESEAIMNDPAYAVALEPSAVRRIAALPCSVSEALPHLRSDEVRTPLEPTPRTPSLP